MIIRDPKVRDYPVNKILKREKLFKNLLLKSFCSYRWFSITIRKKIVKIFSRCRYYSIPNSHSFYRNNLFVDRSWNELFEYWKDSQERFNNHFPKFNYRLRLDRFTERETRNFFSPHKPMLQRPYFLLSTHTVMIENFSEPTDE